MEPEAGGRTFKLVLLITTYDENDGFRGALVEVTLTGVFAMRLDFERNEAPFVFGLGISYAPSEDGHYFDLWSFESEDVGEIRRAKFFIGFGGLTFEILQSNLWEDPARS